MPVEVEEPVRRMVVDGQSVFMTPGISATRALEEIAKRRAEKGNDDA
jgi:hypothetical protein